LRGTWRGDDGDLVGDLAIEALRVIRGLGVADAKGIVMDAVFPTSPLGSEIVDRGA
jgi:hypothetical protein